MLADISNFFICQSCNDQSLLEEHNYPFNVNTVAAFWSNTLTVLFAKSIGTFMEAIAKSIASSWNLCSIAMVSRSLQHLFCHNPLVSYTCTIL